MRVLIKNQQRHRSLNKAKIKGISHRILSLLEQPEAELSILFVGDKKMQELNTTFRGIPKTTDVLSFPQIEFGFQRKSKLNASRITHHTSLLLGDIVINLTQAKKQAKRYGLSFYDEIYRLLIHGILHLLGYNHKKEDKMARVMKKKEEELFNAIKKVN